MTTHDKSLQFSLVVKAKLQPFVQRQSFSTDTINGAYQRNKIKTIFPDFKHLALSTTLFQGDNFWFSFLDACKSS